MIKLDTEKALAYTEALAIKGVSEPTILIWQEPTTVAALGISQSAETELNITAITKDNVRIVRRQSGGGAVILNQNTLCFEVIAPTKHSLENLSIRESFEYYTKPLINILKNHNLNASISGISDITVNVFNKNKKVAGCAQLRKRKALVVHTSILINLNKSILEKYLKFPSDVPDYRKNRSHTDFCLNLSEVIPNITAESLSLELTKSFSELGWNILNKKPENSDLSDELLTKKYSQNTWNVERIRPKISQQ